MRLFPVPEMPARRRNGLVRRARIDLVIEIKDELSGFCLNDNRLSPFTSVSPNSYSATFLRISEIYSSFKLNPFVSLLIYDKLSKTKLKRDSFAIS